MKRYVRLTAWILFLSLTFFPSIVRGQAADRPGKEAAIDSPRASRDFLGLTPEQKAKLEEFRKMEREKRRAHFENMRKVQLEMRKMMKDPDANEKEILKLYDQMSTLRAQQFKDALLRRKEYRKILTPEQLEKLEKFRKRISQRRNVGRGRFMGRRGFARRGYFPRRGRMDSFRRGGARLRSRPFMFRRWRR
jgi:Spy/CpxP family protein refolding chaperone